MGAQAADGAPWLGDHKTESCTHSQALWGTYKETELNNKGQCRGNVSIRLGKGV